MEPVSLPGAGMYEALQRGIVDCVMADATDMVASDLTEVAKHYTTVNLPGFTAYGIFIGQDAWDSLSPEQQTIVWEQIPVYLESLTSEGLKLQEELLETPGMEFHTMEDDLAEALADHQQSVLDDAAANAPESLADPQAAVVQFVELHDTWGSVVENDLAVTPYDSWADWHEDGGTADSIDTGAFAQRVYDEIFATSMPQ
jgi:TRAP-type C4-dicarboxylate transport system substrate-binding protein